MERVRHEGQYGWLQSGDGGLLRVYYDSGLMSDYVEYGEVESVHCVTRVDYKIWIHFVPVAKAKGLSLSRKWEWAYEMFEAGYRSVRQPLILRRG